MSPWNLSVASFKGKEADFNFPPKKAISQSGTAVPGFVPTSAIIVDKSYVLNHESSF